MLMCMHRAAKHDVQKSAHAFSKTCPMSLWTCHAIFWMHPLSCKRLSSGTLCRVNHVVIQADACLLTFVLPCMGTPQVPSIAHAYHHMICTPLKWVPAVEHYVCCFGGLHDLCRHRFACIQTAARAAAVESDFTRGLYPNYLVGDSKIHNTLFRGCIYLGCCPGPESCRHACSRLQGTYIVWLQCFTALLARTTFAMVYIPKTAQPPLSRYQASNHLEQSLQASHPPYMLAAAKRGRTCRRYRDRTASACSMLCTPAKLATRNHFRIRKRQIVACSARFSMLPLEHIFMHSKSLCMPLGAVKVCIGIVRGPVRAYCIVWGAATCARTAVTCASA